MGFNNDKKKKLVELFAKRRAAAASVGTSQALPPRTTLLFMKAGGRESAPEGQQIPPPLELPALLQEALKHFLDREMVESLEGNFLQDRVARGLGLPCRIPPRFYQSARNSRLAGQDEETGGGVGPQDQSFLQL